MQSEHCAHLWPWCVRWRELISLHLWPPDFSATHPWLCLRATPQNAAPSQSESWPKGVQISEGASLLGGRKHFSDPLFFVFCDLSLPQLFTLLWLCPTLDPEAIPLRVSPPPLLLVYAPFTKGWPAVPICRGLFSHHLDWTLVSVATATRLHQLGLLQPLEESTTSRS